MSTPRVEPPRDAEGKLLSYDQRKAIRTTADRERKHADQIQRQEDKAAAALIPPAPRPTFHERQATRRAEDFGRRQADDAAEAQAKANAGPINIHRVRADELKSKLYLGPRIERRYEQSLERAAEWDRQQAAAKAAAEKQAAIDSDPAVRLARDYAAGLVKLAPAEFAEEAAECVGIAQQGDSALAWQRMKVLDEKIFQRADRLAAEKLAGKTASDAEFNALAIEAEAARERAAESAKMIPNI